MFLLFVLVSVVGCGSVPANHRTQAPPGWHKRIIEAKPFQLDSLWKQPIKQADVVTIYIEGDGHAWISRQLISPDPTPRDPVALKLAQADRDASVVYLARPCQYVMSEACHYRYWTHARFSEVVIQAMNAAIDQIKATYGANAVNLVGFSGGGAVSIILASRRKDVTHLIVVGGNIDPAVWANFHALALLKGSINPMDVLDNVPSSTNLCFLYGKEDKVFPPPLVRQFEKKVHAIRPDALFKTAPGVGHAWPAVSVKRLCREQ